MVPATGWQGRLGEVFASPRVGSAGEALWERLSNDRQLAAAGEAYLQRTFAQPRFARLVQHFSEQHPDFTDAQFGDLMQQRVDSFTGQPAYDSTFADAFATPTVMQAMQRWLGTIAYEQQLGEALVAFVTDPNWQPVWRSHLGVTVNSAELMAALSAEMGSERGARLGERIALALVEDPALEEMLAQLLSAPDFFAIVRGQLLGLLRSREFARAADACLLEVLEGREFERQLLALERLLHTLAVQQAVQNTFVLMERSRQVDAILLSGITRMLDNLRRNQQLARDLTVQHI